MGIRSCLFRIIHDHIKKDDLFANYRMLLESQYWDEDKMQAYQFGLLRKLLVDAYDDTLYYKELFDGLGINPRDIRKIEDLRQLPILTKNDITQNLESMTSRKRNPKNSKTNSTSGSTGVALKFYSPTNVTMMRAIMMRCSQWMGVGLDDRTLQIWGHGFGEKEGFVKRLKLFLNNNKVISGYDLSDADMEEIIEVFRKRKPKLFITYPSILEHIGNYCIPRKIEIRVDVIRIGGEKLYPHQRELAMKVFGAPVFDFYGSRDITSIAMECKEHHGLHIMSENVIVEVQDDNGNFVTEGEGDLIVTHLHNWVTPFIRYRIGDRVRISQRKCSCGRKLPLIEEVLGRSFDMITFPNGNSVMGPFWTFLFKSKPGIDQFSVHLVAKDRLTIKYVARNMLSDAAKEYFVSEIKKKSGAGLKVDFVLVDSIPVTSAGKLKFVFDETRQP